MKIIDLFFKIVNDKEIPGKIKHKGLIYEYQKEDRDYVYIDKNSYYTWFINETISDITCLNDEVEIIEEQQDIDIQDIKERIERIEKKIDSFEYIAERVEEMDSQKGIFRYC